MSQFILCKSNENLSRNGGILFDSEIENILLYQTVLEQYFPNIDNKNVWVIKDIHNFCDTQLKQEEYLYSDIFCIMNRLYDVCEWILLWYGDDYRDLEELHTKERFLKYIGNKIENPCCELYAKVDKRQLRDIE